MNEPELGAGIDSGIQSSILVKARRDSNPQPFDHESSPSSPLTTRQDLRPISFRFAVPFSIQQIKVGFYSQKKTKIKCRSDETDSNPFF
jgi:hypothetical protein